MSIVDGSVSDEDGVIDASEGVVMGYIRDNQSATVFSFPGMC